MNKVINLIKRFLKYLKDRRDAECRLRDLKLTQHLYLEILAELEDGYHGNYQGMLITEETSLMHDHMTDANQYTSSLFELIRISVYANVKKYVELAEKAYKDDDFEEVERLFKEWYKSDEEMAKGHRLKLPKVVKIEDPVSA